MASINFNQGYKEYDIGGDPNRVIRFVPSDFNLPHRIEQSMTAIEKLEEQYKNANKSDNFAGEMAACDAAIREQINYIFDSDVCTVAFGNINCTSIAGGHPLYWNFLNAILPEIEKCINEEKSKSEKNIAKYTEQVK